MQQGAVMPADDQIGECRGRLTDVMLGKLLLHGRADDQQQLPALLRKPREHARNAVLVAGARRMGEDVGDAKHASAAALAGGACRGWEKRTQLKSWMLDGRRAHRWKCWRHGG